jgi:nitroreductase
MLTPDELLTTTRSVRRRLDLQRPVERGTVEECLQLALQAPSAANRQSGYWILIDDPVLRADIARIYRDARRDPTLDRVPGDRPPLDASIAASGQYLADNLHRVPILVVPTIAEGLARSSTYGQASTWGSILPAVWSFMLALRSRGLGSAWTTTSLKREQDMAEVLGIKDSGLVQAGLFPVAYTIGTQFKPGRRGELTSSFGWNRRR